MNPVKGEPSLLPQRIKNRKLRELPPEFRMQLGAELRWQEAAEHTGGATFTDGGLHLGQQSLAFGNVALQLKVADAVLGQRVLHSLEYLAHDRQP